MHFSWKVKFLKNFNAGVLPVLGKKKAHDLLSHGVKRAHL